MPKIIIQCQSCGGTGLYMGMAEKNGAAVVCTTCNGRGSKEFEYKEFEGRKIRQDVKRVYERCDYMLSSEDVTTEDGRLIKFSEAGCTYEEWLNGAEPKPVKELYCPYVWRNRGIGNEPLEKCVEQLRGICRITDCKLYRFKEQCWKEYEEKQKNKFLA